MPPSKRSEQLVRMAELRRFVGELARAEDREATAEALTALAQASHDSGLVDEAHKRAQQALHLLEDQNASETNVRALLKLASVCLEMPDIAGADRASMLAIDRAAALEGTLADELGGSAALLAGISCAMRDDAATARRYLDTARDRLVAGGRPDGAALALTQLGLLETGAGRWDAAGVCFQFAREFYRAAGKHADAADVGSIAAHALADAPSAGRDTWFREAAADAERAGNHIGAAALTLELADLIASEGDPTRARELAHEALPQLRKAFAQALGTRAAEGLASVLEVLVGGLVRQRLGEPGWQLLDKFRDDLMRWGFHALAASAREARQLVARAQ